MPSDLFYVVKRPEVDWSKWADDQITHVKKVFKQRRAYVVVPNQYGGWKQRVADKVTRLAWWVLGKTCKVSHEEVRMSEYEYETIQIDLSKLADLIYEEQGRELMRNPKGVEMIILGAKAMHDLRMELAHFSFHVPLDVDPDNPRLLTFAGMPIKCVPTFKGVLVVPKERW